MKGDKVYIRILEKTDIEKTQKWINDPFISDIMGYLPVLSYANQIDWYEKIKNDKTRFVFAICRVENDEHIGNFGLGKIDYLNRHCMLNIFIADKNYRSEGYGVEALLLGLQFAFNRLNMNKVYLQTSERFVEAKNLYHKVGFQQEGILRQHYYSNGLYEDKIIFSILKSEFDEEKFDKRKSRNNI